jgi:hypothetical protein
MQRIPSWHLAYQRLESRLLQAKNETLPDES